MPAFLPRLRVAAPRPLWAWQPWRAALGVCAAVLGACTRPAPEPRLTHLEPARVAARAGAQVTLHGEHLLPKVQVDFDAPSQVQVEDGFSVALVRGDARVPLSGVEHLSTEALSVDVPLVSSARYGVELTDPYGRTARLESGLEVVQCTQPQHCLDGATCDSAGDCRLADGGLDPRLPDGGLPPVDAGAGCADVDRDGAAAPGCPQAAQVDCDDLDPFSAPGLTEVCDGRDNDCDGVPDNDACPADAGWTPRADTGGPNHDWWTASAWAPGAVWIAGKPDRLFVHTPDAGFEDRSSGCDGYFRASWVDARNGTVYLGGARNPGNQQARLAHRALDDTACTHAGPEGGGQVTGLFGFTASDGGVNLYGVKGTGATFRWDPAADSYTPLVDTGLELNHLHGVDLNTLFAVGVNRAPVPDVPRVLRFQPATQTWSDEGVQLLPGVAGTALHAVHVASPSLAHAVGDKGLVLRWDGAGWSVLPAPADVTLRAVIAFGASQLYTADSSGFIRRFDGAQWEVLFSQGLTPAIPFFGIAGTSPGDLWVVGNDGWVVRWP